MAKSGRPLFFALAFVLSGCASILSGTSETVSFDSNPPGANCDLERDGKIIGSVATPGGLVVKKTKNDIHVTCKKAGYQDSTGFLKSGIQGETWGNIVLGGVVGWAVDSAAGADNEYPDHITITMVPNQTPAAAQAATAGSPPPPPVWRTNADNVQAYTTAGWEPVPMSVSLVLVEQQADQGLFRYPDSKGRPEEGWISMASVHRQQ